MVATSDYKAGTITLTNGSATVTGTATAFDSIAMAREGDMLIDIPGAQGHEAVLGDDAKNTGNSTLTLTKNWEGPTLANVAYRLRYHWDANRWTAVSIELLALLKNGILSGLASITGGANKLPYMTGPTAWSTVNFLAWAQTFLGANNQGEAQDALGATATGKSLFTATNAAAVRTAAGMTAVGSSVATAVDAAAVRTAAGIVPVGDVATGAYFQRGSNANGEFVRFQDGTQICWRRITGLGPINTAWGSGMFISSAYSSYSYPATFIAAPVDVVTVGADGVPAIALVQNGSSTSAFSPFYLARGVSSASTAMVASLTSIGRWKA